MVQIMRSETPERPMNDIQPGATGLVHEAVQAEAMDVNQGLAEGEMASGVPMVLEPPNLSSDIPPQDPGGTARPQTPIITVKDMSADSTAERSSNMSFTPVLDDAARNQTGKGNGENDTPLTSPTKRSLVPPNPFALTRSHSSFIMSARKARQTPMRSTVDVLRRISHLTQALVRASEEKLGLAGNAYDLVRRRADEHNMGSLWVLNIGSSG